MLDVRPRHVRCAIGSRFLLVVVLLAAVAARAAAQTVTGTVQGTVTDTTGSPLPGVSVSIQNIETAAARTITTNERGQYSAPFMPLGRYKLTASLSGFGTVVREGTVTLNSTTVVDFRLDPAITQETTVVAEPPRINTTNQQVQQSLNSEQILDKPTFQNLNNNNTFLTLAETFAGFQENPTGGQNNPTASSGSSINFNGTGTRGDISITSSDSGVVMRSSAGSRKNARLSPCVASPCQTNRRSPTISVYSPSRTSWLLRSALMGAT